MNASYPVTLRAMAFAAFAVLSACSASVHNHGPLASSSDDARRVAGVVAPSPSSSGRPPQCAPCGGTPTTKKTYFNWP